MENEKHTQDCKANSYKIGKYVKVLHCFNGHEFEIGEVVCIIAKSNYDDRSFLCKNKKGAEWYLYKEECEVLLNHCDRCYDKKAKLDGVNFFVKNRIFMAIKGNVAKGFNASDPKYAHYVLHTDKATAWLKSATEITEQEYLSAFDDFCKDFLSF